MRRSIINKIIVGTLVFTGVSCTGDYMDINSNPYQPGTDDMQADDYMLGSAMNNLSSCGRKYGTVHRLLVGWTDGRLFLGYQYWMGKYDWEL